MKSREIQASIDNLEEFLRLPAADVAKQLDSKPCQFSLLTLLNPDGVPGRLHDLRVLQVVQGMYSFFMKTDVSVELCNGGGDCGQCKCPIVIPDIPPEDHVVCSGGFAQFSLVCPTGESHVHVSDRQVTS